jgi:hypothetical protein
MVWSDTVEVDVDEQASTVVEMAMPIPAISRRAGLARKRFLLPRP